MSQEDIKNKLEMAKQNVIISDIEMMKCFKEIEDSCYRSSSGHILNIGPYFERCEFYQTCAYNYQIDNTFYKKQVIELEDKLKNFKK